GLTLRRGNGNCRSGRAGSAVAAWRGLLCHRDWRLGLRLNASLLGDPHLRPHQICQRLADRPWIARTLPGLVHLFEASVGVLLIEYPQECGLPLVAARICSGRRSRALGEAVSNRRAALCFGPRTPCLWFSVPSRQSKISPDPHDDGASNRAWLP